MATATAGKCVLVSFVICVWYSATTIYNIRTKLIFVRIRPEHPGPTHNTHFTDDSQSARQVAGASEAELACAVAAWLALALYAACTACSLVLEALVMGSRPVIRMGPSSIGIISTIGTCSQLLGLTFASVIAVQTLKCLEPVLVLVWYWLLDRKFVLPGQLWLPFGLTIGGVALLTTADSRHNGQQQEGALLALLCGCCFSLRNVLMKRATTYTFLPDHAISVVTPHHTDHRGDVVDYSDYGDNVHHHSLDGGESILPQNALGRSSRMRQQFLDISVCGLCIVALSLAVLGVVKPGLLLAAAVHVSLQEYAETSLLYFVYNYASFMMLSYTSAVTHSTMNVPAFAPAIQAPPKLTAAASTTAVSPVKMLKRPFVFAGAAFVFGAPSSPQARAGSAIALLGVSSFSLIKGRAISSKAVHVLLVVATASVLVAMWSIPSLDASAQDKAATVDPTHVRATTAKPGFPSQGTSSVVKLFCWCGHNNFGDELSLYIVQSMACDPVRLVDRHEKGKILAVGSILHDAEPGDVVWGSGLLNPRWGVPPGDKITVAAVRGKLTAEFLRENGYSVPDVYGDPALLLPHFYQPALQLGANASRVACRPLVLAHKDDYADMVLKAKGQFSVVPAVATDWRIIVDQILAARIVLSSSLHGIIVAEAYGVPAYHVLGNHSSNPRLLKKFGDYYSASGRRDIVVDLLRASHDESFQDGLVQAWQPPLHDVGGLVDAFPGANCFDQRDLLRDVDNANRGRLCGSRSGRHRD